MGDETRFPLRDPLEAGDDLAMQSSLSSAETERKFQAAYNYMRSPVQKTEQDLYAPVDVSPTVQKPRSAQGVGVVEEFGRGLKRGIALVGEGLTTPFAALGMQSAEEAAKFWADAANRNAPSYEGNIWEQPDAYSFIKYLTGSIAEQIPTIAAMMIGGEIGAIGARGVGLLRVGSQALKVTPGLILKLSRIGAAVGGGTVGGLLGGSNAYNEILRRGGSKEEAIGAMAIFGLASAGLSAINADQLLHGVPGMAAQSLKGRFLKGGALNAALSWVQSPIESVTLGAFGYETRDQAWERMKSSFSAIPATFVVGGALGALQPAQRAVNKLTKTGISIGADGTAKPIEDNAIGQFTDSIKSSSARVDIPFGAERPWQFIIADPKVPGDRGRVPNELVTHIATHESTYQIGLAYHDAFDALLGQAEAAMPELAKAHADAGQKAAMFGISLNMDHFGVIHAVGEPTPEVQKYGVLMSPFTVWRGVDAEYAKTYIGKDLARAAGERGARAMVEEILHVIHPTEEGIEGKVTAFVKEHREAFNQAAETLAEGYRTVLHNADFYNDFTKLAALRDFEPNIPFQKLQKHVGKPSKLGKGAAGPPPGQPAPPGSSQAAPEAPQPKPAEAPGRAPGAPEGVKGQEAAPNAPTGNAEAQIRVASAKDVKKGDSVTVTRAGKTIEGTVTEVGRAGIMVDAGGPLAEKATFGDPDVVIAKKAPAEAQAPTAPEKGAQAGAVHEGPVLNPMDQLVSKSLGGEEAMRDYEAARAEATSQTIAEQKSGGMGKPGVTQWTADVLQRKMSKLPGEEVTGSGSYGYTPGQEVGEARKGEMTEAERIQAKYDRESGRRPGKLLQSSYAEYEKKLNVRWNFVNGELATQMAAVDSELARQGELDTIHRIQTHKETREKAAEVGPWSVMDALMLPDGSPLWPHEILLARGLLIRVNRTLADAAEKYRAGGPGSRRQFALAFALADAVTKKLDSFAATSGRGLNIWGAEAYSSRPLALETLTAKEIVEIQGYTKGLDVKYSTLKKAIAEEGQAPLQARATNAEKFQDAIGKAARLTGKPATHVEADVRRAMGIEGADRIKADIVNSVVEMANELEASQGGSHLLEMYDTLVENRQKAYFRKTVVPGMLYEAWYGSLLSGPPTWTINFLSNAYMVLKAPIERAVAELGVGGERTANDVARGEAAAMVHGFTSMLQEAWVFFKKAMKDPQFLRAMSPDEHRMYGMEKFADTTPRPMISSENMALSQNPVAQFLSQFADGAGAVIGFGRRLLYATDVAFKVINYRMELQAEAYRVASAEGGTDAQIAERAAQILADPERSQAIRENAENFALAQTFQRELGPRASAVGKFINAVPLGRLFVPFYRVSVNIAGSAMETTPLGLFSPRVRAELSQPGATRQLAIAKMALGSAVSMALLPLVANGTITGAGPADKESNDLWRNAGNQPYSVNIGGIWVAYSRLDPLGMTLGLMADMATLMARVPHDGPYAQQAEAMAMGVAQAFSNVVVNKTYLEGLGNIFESMMRPNEATRGVAAGFIRSLVPTGLRRLAMAVDPIIKRTRTLMEEYQSGIPGWASKMFPRRNLFGEPVIAGVASDDMLGPGLLASAYIMVSPINIAGTKKDPVAQEVLRSGVQVGMPQDFIMGRRPPALYMETPRPSEGIPLSGEQYDRFVRLAGNELKMNGVGMKDALRELFASADYKAQSDGPDGGKAALIKTIVYQYREAARRQILDEFAPLRGSVVAQQEARRAARQPMISVTQ